MKTLSELQAKTRILNGQLTVYENGGGFSIVMPLTKAQVKDGQTTGDFCVNTDLNVIAEWLDRWEEFQTLKYDVTKKEIKEFVRARLQSNDKWATHALEVLMAKQTVEEQRTDRTTFNNGVGFTGHDGPILSSFAKQWRYRQWLSAKQMTLLHKTIVKYWSQVIDASDTFKLLKQVKSARNAQLSLRLS